MESWIIGLLVITVPIDLLIVVGGVYLIKAYSHEQALIREAAHDAEITQREEIRFRTALAKSGQYEGPAQEGGSDFMAQIMAAAGPLLLEKLKPVSPEQTSAPVQQVK